MYNFGSNLIKIDGYGLNLSKIKSFRTILTYKNSLKTKVYKIRKYRDHRCQMLKK